MRAALADAAPHGLHRARAGWFACLSGGGWSSDQPCYPPGTVAGLVDRRLLRIVRGDRAEITDLGRHRLAQLSGVSGRSGEAG